MDKIKSKLILFITFFLTISNYAFGNDGGFYAKGNTLFPLKSTNIELKKEVLYLTLDKAFLRVNINFTFYNPSDEQTILVGFVTPPADGVVTDEEKKHPQIKDFIVYVNNELIEFNITSIDSTDFKLYNKENFDGKDFIYYFPVTFKKGINTVQHSYSYIGSFNILPIKTYDYKLTTGKLWANKQIEDFELIINLGEDIYFHLPERMQNQNDFNMWETIGIGRLLNKNDVNSTVTGYVKSGSIRYRAKNFVPEFDFRITIIDKMFEFNSKFRINYFAQSLKDNDVIWTDEELRILKNSLFAFKGYDFKSKDLHNYFSQYAWYIPDPLIKNDLNIFTEWEQKRFFEIEELIKSKTKE
ncbi:MAG: YARHG domain-containing protein [Candidatus Methanofastidiosum sp.]|nr:YARHG domain-containing protein [Methanofastidiosum sp.]